MLAPPLILGVAIWFINREFVNLLFSREHPLWEALLLVEVANACFLLVAYSFLNKRLPEGTTEQTLRLLVQRAIPIVSLMLFTLPAMLLVILGPTMVQLVQTIGSLGSSP